MEIPGLICENNVCIHHWRFFNCLSGHHGYADTAGRRYSLEGMGGKLCCLRIGNHSCSSPFAGEKNVGSIILVGRCDHSSRFGTEYLFLPRLQPYKYSMTEN